MYNMEKVLDRFGSNVVKFSRANLTRKDKNVKRNLYNSIAYTKVISKSGKSFGFNFEMEDYGDYQDKGVSGTERKFDTVFSFRNKMPPLAPLLEWVKARNLKFRDTKGRYSKGSQIHLADLIRRKIFRKGIKPTLFFTKPFEAAFNHLPDEMVEAYGLDIDGLLNFTRNGK